MNVIQKKYQNGRIPSNKGKETKSQVDGRSEKEEVKEEGGNGGDEKSCLRFSLSL